MPNPPEIVAGLSDEAEIAGRLSEEQRRPLVLAEETIGGDFKVPIYRRTEDHHGFKLIRFTTLRILERYRLVHAGYSAILTDTGLAVRAHLLEHPNAE